MRGLVDLAAKAAELVLAVPLPERWAHVEAVAGKASDISRVLGDEDGKVLVASAWLHDVGYAPGIARTGLHALDGARWLSEHGWPKRIAALVAYHSCALFEAEERGLAHWLTAEFAQEQTPTADALWFADMTTGPDGRDLGVSDRLAEVRQRYGPDHLVTRFWARAEPSLLQAVRRTEALLAAQPM